MTTSMLYHDIQNFLQMHHIDYQAQNLDLITHINHLLTPFWRGTCPQLDFSSCSHAQKTEFPCYVPIDHAVVQNLIQQTNFTVFQRPQSLLYFSASLPCFLVDNLHFQQHLYAFMDEFCFLVTFFLLDPTHLQNTAPTHLDTLPLLECSPFNYFYGHVTHLD